MTAVPDPEEIIDEDYLPFTSSQLEKHFADVRGPGDPHRHLDYYLASQIRRNELRQAIASGILPLDRGLLTMGNQMEKDERFWVVAALLGLFHAPDRVAALSAALNKCFSGPPPFEDFDTWEALLGNHQDLFFEANLPSPVEYQRFASTHRELHMLNIPYLTKAAALPGRRAEGPTHVDAVLISDTGFAVLFEAKVLSDTSCTTTFDVTRNQIARNIDVMLDSNPRLQEPLKSRDPDLTCFALLTPELLRENRWSRLYGWLYDAYTRDTELLVKHLPHRTVEELATVPLRLGWLTYEECNDIQADVCKWLTAN
jgi:hypothetical protein